MEVVGDSHLPSLHAAWMANLLVCSSILTCSSFDGIDNPALSDVDTRLSNRVCVVGNNG